MESGAPDRPAELWLADWRRRIAELYAEVRRLATDDPPAAHAHWRAERERLFRHHPQSPVPPAQRGTFRARHFRYQPALRFEAKLESGGPPGLGSPGGRPIELPTSGPEVLAFRRVGEVTLPFADRPRRLVVFWMEAYAGGLFLPFRDATNGRQTYGAGRYLLDGAKGADLGGDPERGTLVLDFNFAFQPSCAFDPRWACPLAPPENGLDVPIRAGERLA
ncbi:MAG: DUF1684 domain-containing protein [Chloroflexota bacterium]